MEIRVFVLFALFTVHVTKSTLVLSNGCEETKDWKNVSDTNRLPGNMPLPLLNCSVVGLTRLYVEEGMADVKSLTLSDNNLIEFHVDDLLPFSGLRTLVLDRNKITQLFPSHENPKAVFLSVSHLSISLNQLREIDTNALSSFPSLEVLQMSDNLIRAVSANAFGIFAQLQVLDMSRNPIGFIEENAFFHLNLTKLNLRSCGLTRLPKISAMSSLVDLDVSINQLTYLESNTFLNCNKLEKLDLSSNFIQSIDPIAFEGVKNLKAIDLSNNQISIIPDGVFNHFITHKLKLNLYENPIACDCTNMWLRNFYTQVTRMKLQFKCAQPLRNHGKKAHQIQMVDLFCSEADEQWTDCSKSSVSTIVASHANHSLPCPDRCTCFDENGARYASHENSDVFQADPKRIDGFKLNRILPLSVFCNHVGLTRIPVESIPSDVIAILLTENNITTIDLSLLTKFKNLQKLVLKKNKIAQIKNSPNVQIPTLKILNLGVNNLTSITSKHLRSFPNLVVLSLYHNNIGEFQNDLFVNNKQLRRLFLGNNPAKQVGTGFLQGLDLRKLSLRNLSLKVVPTEISKMNNLIFLDLCDNLITTLQNDSFLHCPVLHRLVLENNKISTVEVNAFNGARNLHWILLAENNIRNLPRGIFANASWENLNVKMWSNPMLCDCKLKWLKSFIEESEERDPTTDIRFICQTPSRMQNRKSDHLRPEDFVCFVGDDMNETPCSAYSAPGAGFITLATVMTFVLTSICFLLLWRYIIAKRNILPYLKQLNINETNELITM